MTTGDPLGLLEQLDYTSGLCGAFALGAREVLGGQLCLLYSDDPDLLERHDAPPGEEMCLHAFLMVAPQVVVDAEGQGNLADMAKGFGLDPGCRYRVADVDREGLLSEMPGSDDPARRAEVACCLAEARWSDGVPARTEVLSLNFAAARALQRERAEARRQDDAECEP